MTIREIKNRLTKVEAEKNNICPVRVLTPEDLTDEELKEIIGIRNPTDEQFRRIAQGAKVVIVDDISTNFK